MSVEPLDRLDPHRTEPFTFADLDAAPDDGVQRELIDGALFMTPAPSKIHQRAAHYLGHILELSRPPGLEILGAPFEYRPTRDRSVQPDLMVLGPDNTNPAHADKPLLLAVEILSPSTKLVDLRLKRGVYEEAGVRSSWIVDPVKQSLTVLELVDGAYVERDVVIGEKVFEAELPYPVRVVPADLFRQP